MATLPTVRIANAAANIGARERTISMPTDDRAAVCGRHDVAVTSGTRTIRVNGTPAKILGAVVAFVAIAPVAAGAQPRPLAQRILSRGAVTQAAISRVPRAVHDVSGAVVSLRGEALGLRIRSGRVQAVDATDAFASGRVSAPLFIGKLVEVAGSYDGHHVLRATSITRVPRVDATTPLDR